MTKKRTKEFHIIVLGKTLEHLGVQMYKKRDVAIAELVANSWDAGAKEVKITIPEESKYDNAIDKIIITDNGEGMNEKQVENEYLIVGRNRRLFKSEGKTTRPIMGRKGIGKLAGFGVANTMKIMTWKDKISTTFSLDMANLKKDAGVVGKVPIEGIIEPITDEVDSISGTSIILSNLKHKTPVKINNLMEALSRRFSKKIRGEMRIIVNDLEIGEPIIDLTYRYPENDYEEFILPSGKKIKYFFGFSDHLIRSSQLQGFTIYVRGKTAQAPPFFFNVEGIATGLHYTRYMTGVIEADYLDENPDDESDLISTDRQEIDWADERTYELKEWGEATTKRALREWSENKGKRLEERIFKIEEFAKRIKALDPSSQKQVSKFLKQLGQTNNDIEQNYKLSDSLIRVFEYKHFHDVISQIEDVSEDPKQLSLLLTHLQEWKVLESRAILEIINGRIEIIEKFHSMIVNNAPEIASKKSPDNMHDLVANYPWILKAEWQVLAEEKSITKQLNEWHINDCKSEEDKLRYDFIALNDEKQLVIIEIKRSDHPIELKELQRLETYREKLTLGTEKKIFMILIYGGKKNITAQTYEFWNQRGDAELVTWAKIYETTKKHYIHYKAVLSGDTQNEDFFKKEKELAKTREIIDGNSLKRTKDERKEGLGPQDTNLLS